MEFGNNLLRFGKFIKLGFNRAGMLQGATVQTYLLEKVHIGYHASGERNYHIFLPAPVGGHGQAAQEVRLPRRTDRRPRAVELLPPRQARGGATAAGILG